MNERVPANNERRFAAWLDHHGASLTSSLRRLLTRPWATLLTVGVMALALALPLGLWLLMSSVTQLSGQVQSARSMTAFLQLGLSPAQVEDVTTRLQQRHDVAHVEWVGAEQALAQMRQREDLAAAIDALGDEAAQAALPGMLQITPQGDEQALLDALGQFAEVERVQYDALWQERLQAWLALGQRVVQLLSLLLAMGALLVVGNTVRLDIQSRHEEIGVLQLLGASDGFVRRPFLYLGAWYGVLAGGLALAILLALAKALQPSLSMLVKHYNSTFVLQSLTPLTMAAVLFGAALLGWIGAGLVTGHYLRQHRPKER
jgi:cell division transport system permease protein